MHSKTRHDKQISGSMTDAEIRMLKAMMEGEKKPKKLPKNMRKKKY